MITYAFHIVSIKNRKRHFHILHGVPLIKLQFALDYIFFCFLMHHHFSQHDTNLLFILGRPILLKQLLLHRLIDSLAFIFLSHIPSALFFLVISFLHTLLYRVCSVMLYFHPSLIDGLFLIYDIVWIY